MNRGIYLGRGTPLARILFRLAAVVAIVGAPSEIGRAGGGGRGESHSESDDGYVSRQENLSLKYDTDIEVVTPAVEKVQFSASGDVTMSRPNKFRISRAGGYADIELVSDGSSVTIHDRGGDRFAQVPGGGAFDEVVDRLRATLRLNFPEPISCCRNPMRNSWRGCSRPSISAAASSRVSSEHLAFRNLETDWQIWVEVGEKPVPRKYVITSKAVGAAPQYTLRLRDWKTGVAPAPDAFAFKPPAGSTRSPITLLDDIDEIPAGVVPGGAK